MSLENLVGLNLEKITPARQTAVRLLRSCVTFLVGFIAANGRAETTIPLEIRQGNVLARAAINRVPLKLVIDLGGLGSLSLKADAIARTGVAPLPATISQTDALGNTAERRTFNVSTLELGNGVFRDITAHEVGGYAASGAGDGLIGRDFLKRFVVVFDYPSRVVTLYSPQERKAADRACGGDLVPTIPDPDGIIVSVATSDHGPLRMLWDTGASYSFVKAAVAAQRHLPVQGETYRTRHFALGARDFGPLELVSLALKEPANVDGYIGYNFFASHVVCVDALGAQTLVRVK
ncbi:MAG TPA: hypothetical protein VFE23_13760 [Usitatibacter sp.]|jgi:hypothetical protein|nr:hypothetical protein [Usitatibacter sp.]